MVHASFPPLSISLCGGVGWLAYLFFSRRVVAVCRYVYRYGYRYVVLVFPPLLSPLSRLSYLLV